MGNTKNNFDEIYLGLINNILNEGEEVLNKRTGIKIKQVFGRAFTWDMKYLPLLNCRQMYPATAAAELAWMLQGTKDITIMRTYSKIWDKFTDDDNPNEIKTAYGYRWSHSFGYDQIYNIIEKFKQDPTSRQQVLMSWNPMEDNIIPNKNIPCPYTAVIGIVNGKLNIHLSLRSNDIVIGMPYDVFVYTLLGQALAASLDIEPGELFYSIANAHIYENHMQGIEMLFNNPYYKEEYKAVFIYDIFDIRKNPYLYIEEIIKYCDSIYGDRFAKIKFEINK